MKLMRLAMCVAAFALVGKIALSEDMDVRALQAKLAAQEARLNDLQAKMYGAACGDEKKVADGLTSLRKNAVVTIGGNVNTRYFYRSGKVESALDVRSTRLNGQEIGYGQDNRRATRMREVGNMKYGDLRVTDAKVEVKIDVNDYFDAYVKMDLQDGDFARAGVAQNYWVRWKNVCNSGFGLLIGRDALKFGGVTPYGIIGSWTKNNDGYNDVINMNAMGETLGPRVLNDGQNMQGRAFGARGPDGLGEGMFVGNGNMPTRTIWDFSRTTQINPYWESQGGAFKAELSLLQSIDTRQNVAQLVNTDGTGSVNPVQEWRTVNYGLGSGTLRLTWKPIEGLKLVASAMNLYAKNWNGRWGARQGLANSGKPFKYDETQGGVVANAVNTHWVDGAGAIQTNDSNTAINLAFEYRPCFFDRVNIWGSWTHGWNEGWIKDMDSDTISYGFGFDVTDQLIFFAQGDWMRVKNQQGNLWHKASGWAAYAGLTYTLPYGVNLEAGYRHEVINYKDRNGFKHTKGTADTVYAHLGFNF